MRSRWDDISWLWWTLWWLFASAIVRLTFVVFFLLKFLHIEILLKIFNYQFTTNCVIIAPSKIFFFQYFGLWLNTFKTSNIPFSLSCTMYFYQDKYKRKHWITSTCSSRWPTKLSPCWHQAKLSMQLGPHFLTKGPQVELPTAASRAPCCITSISMSAKPLTAPPP